MFEENPTAGRDELREILAGCQIKTHRDGLVVAIGAPPPKDLLSSPRLIAVNIYRDAIALTRPDVLKHAKAGICWITNGLGAAHAVLDCLKFYGAPA
jgi:hypothetical protein